VLWWALTSWGLPSRACCRVVAPVSVGAELRSLIPATVLLFGSFGAGMMTSKEVFFFPQVNLR